MPATPYIAMYYPPVRAGAKRRSRGLALLLPALAGLLAGLFAGCDSYNLSFKEFYEGGGPPLLTNTADITAYINGYTGPNPVPLAVDITLSAGGWTGLLNAIAAANPFRPVALDLSACDAGTHSAGGGFYSDGTFDPDNTNLSIAKSYIVSLVLPNAAEKIAAGSGTSSTFQNFTNLEAVSGAGITTIGGNAFRNCTALTAITPANFPAATSIGASAFQNCDDLTSVYLPAAASIGSSAFQNCGDLTTVSLPEAASIGSSAFYYCTDLSSAYLPKAASIGASAFLYCVALSSLTLPATPPGLGTNVFQGTGGGTSPGIVIHVPAGAVSGYETGWGVAAVTAANGNPTKYGAGHNAVSITTP